MVWTSRQQVDQKTGAALAAPEEEEGERGVVNGTRRTCRCQPARLDMARGMIGAILFLSTLESVWYAQVLWDLI